MVKKSTKWGTRPAHVLVCPAAGGFLVVPPAALSPLKAAMKKEVPYTNPHCPNRSACLSIVFKSLEPHLNCTGCPDERAYLEPDEQERIGAAALAVSLVSEWTPRELSFLDSDFLISRVIRDDRARRVYAENIRSNHEKL